MISAHIHRVKHGLKKSRSFLALLTNFSDYTEFDLWFSKVFLEFHATPDGHRKPNFNTSSNRKLSPFTLKSITIFLRNAMISISSIPLKTIAVID